MTHPLNRKCFQTPDKRPGGFGGGMGKLGIDRARDIDKKSIKAHITDRRKTHMFNYAYPVATFCNRIPVIGPRVLQLLLHRFL